jgi:hypothetical protein
MLIPRRAADGTSAEQEGGAFAAVVEKVGASCRLSLARDASWSRVARHDYGGDD